MLKLSRVTNNYKWYIVLFIACSFTACNQKGLIKCNNLAKKIERNVEQQSKYEYLWKSDLVILDQLVEKNRNCLIALNLTELTNIFGELEHNDLSGFDIYTFSAINYLGIYNGVQDDRHGLYISFIKDKKTGETIKITTSNVKIIIKVEEDFPSH